MAEGILSVGDGGRDAGTYDIATDSPMTLEGEGSVGDVMVITSGTNVRPQTPGGGGSVGDVGREGVTVDNRIARWHGTDAEVQSSVVSINDDGDISGYGTLTGGDLGTQLVDTDGLLRILAIGQNGATDRQAMLWDDGGGNWIVADILEPGMVDISADTNLAATSPIVLTDDTLSHAVSGVGAATYTSLTVDALGHVTGGTNPGHVLGAGTGTTGTIPLWDPDNNTLGDSALRESGSVVISDIDLAVKRVAIGTLVSLSVSNADDSNSSSSAVLQAATTQATGGDPFAQWTIVGEQSYVLGIDNSDSDKFVGSVGASLGTGNWLEVTTVRGITLDAASGQIVALAVNSVEELQVSGTAVTIPTNNLIIPVGALMVGAATVPRAAVETFGNVYISGTFPNISVDDIVSTLGFQSFDNSGSPPTDDVVASISAIAENAHSSGNFRTGLGFFTMTGTTLTEHMRLSRLGDLFVHDGDIIATLGDIIATLGDVLVPAGSLGIGATPTLPLDVNAKSGHTSIGGIAIKLTNKTGANTVEGHLVSASSSTAEAFDVAISNSDEVIGIVYESGVADGSEAWIVVSGFAMVRVDGGGAALNDRLVSSVTSGITTVNNIPAVAVHFQEVGHAVGVIVGPGLVKTVLHFN